jgi:hypothetical protein
MLQGGQWREIQGQPIQRSRQQSHQAKPVSSANGVPVRDGANGHPTRTVLAPEAVILIEYCHQVSKAQTGGALLHGRLVDLKIHVEARRIHPDPSSGGLGWKHSRDRNLQPSCPIPPADQPIEQLRAARVKHDLGFAVDGKPHAAGLDDDGFARREASRSVRRKRDQGGAVLPDHDTKSSCGRPIHNHCRIAEAGENLESMVRLGVRVAHRGPGLEVVGDPFVSQIAQPHAQGHSSLPGQDTQLTFVVNDPVGVRALDHPDDP